MTLAQKLMQYESEIEEEDLEEESGVGESRLISLIILLHRDGRENEISICINDKNYRKKIYKEYKIN